MRELEIVQRMSTIEAHDEQCSAERKDYDTRLTRLEQIVNQTTGAIRMLTIVAGILTSALGLAVAKAIFGH